MSKEYLDKQEVLRRIKQTFKNLASGDVTKRELFEDMVILDIENMKPSDTDDYVDEVKKRIPEALYDYISEQVIHDQCLSIWIACLECLDEMRDAWEEVNGENLVWVPGHFEKKKKGDEK